MKFFGKLIFGTLTVAVGLVLAVVVLLGLTAFPKEIEKRTLPWRELRTYNHWTISKEVVPAQLQQEGNLIAEFAHGFVDLEQIGLFVLSEKDAQDLLTDLKDRFSEIDDGSDAYGYEESVICIGSEAAGVRWHIDRTKVEEWFKFCANLAEGSRVKWQWNDLNSKGGGFRSINVIHYLETNFFVVSHGMS